MEPEGSLPYSKAPATCPYPEPARSSPYPHILFPEHKSRVFFFRCLGCTRVSAQVRGFLYDCSITRYIFYGEELLVPRPTPQAGGPPLVGCPRLLIQYIRSHPPYRRPFLHPQPEDAPCRGDRDPLTTTGLPESQNVLFSKK